MAVATKRFGKGNLTTTNNTILYTTPTGASALVKAITICNFSASEVQLSISFGGTVIIGGYKIKANDTITIPFLDQVLNAGETIVGFASTASAISYYISGKEVT